MSISLASIFAGIGGAQLGQLPAAQCAGFCATLGASSGRDWPPQACTFNELVGYHGAQNGSIRTHNANVVSSSLTLATKIK
jgi:hypothetical protein